MTAAARAPRHVEPIRREVYSGRAKMGWYETSKTGGGFNAFDAAGKPLGRFTSEGAASHAILSGLLPRDSDGVP